MRASDKHRKIGMLDHRGHVCGRFRITFATLGLQSTAAALVPSILTLGRDPNEPNLLKRYISNLLTLSGCPIRMHSSRYLFSSKILKLYAAGRDAQTEKASTVAVVKLSQCCLPFFLRTYSREIIEGFLNTKRPADLSDMAG